ncbi:cytosine permease [Fodinisporobacter ferrooxydans]|uniref:Cytosine permease n=1 Tax=Fodinisporobacter ferrooxydans TaxID=2901836 RepID=A0ABY4CEL9_9BACL|nr:cytosine permease [Alicyclobacillaceae bacterium MYW30-H2]
MTVSAESTGHGRYRDRILQVEPYGVERVDASERHGTPFQLFTLWLGANLSIADFALGFLPVHLGLSWPMILGSIIIGNILGGVLLALAAVMGPTFGLPQLMIGRMSFGRIGGYLPALLNWISTVGWFTVNNILGVFGLQILFPRLSFIVGSIILILVQGFLAIYGHNLIHSFERIMAVVLGILFLIASFLTGSQIAAVSYAGTTPHPLAMAVIVAGAAFSYIASWAPYASDYSRYLPEHTSMAKGFVWAFLGSVAASLWLEILGAVTAGIAGPHGGNAIHALANVTGRWAIPMVIAIILGGVAANALNLYSNALSAGALDLRMSRTGLTVVAMVVGLFLSLAGAGRFESFYENFLLLLGYWVTPWIAILIVDFFIFRHRSVVRIEKGTVPNSVGSGVGAFLLGILVSIPFMSSTLYTGPVAKLLNGADLSFYVGFLAAGILYFIFRRNSMARA